MVTVTVSTDDLALVLDNTRVTNIDGRPVYEAILRLRRALRQMAHPAPTGSMEAASQALAAVDLDILAYARMEQDVVRYRQESRDWQRKCLDAEDALANWRLMQDAGPWPS